MDKILYDGNMNKKIFKLLYLLIYLLISLVFCLRVLLSDFKTDIRLWLPIIYFGVGGIVAWIFYYFERIVDIYFGNSETKLAMVVRDSFSKKNYKGGLNILKQNEQLQNRLVFRSALFQIIWVALMFFSITSTTSLFGKGLVLGLGLRLFIDELIDYQKDKDKLIGWLFWSVNIKINWDFLKKYLLIFAGLILLFIYMILR